MKRSVLLLALLLPAAAWASPPGATYDISLELVFDVSAPMGARGLYRQAIEGALKELEARSGLPPSVQVSWRVIGGGSPQDQDSACEATQLLVPPGVTPAPVVRAMLPQLTAQGPRPLSAGLQAALSDLPQEPGHQRAVILITSGVDDCDHDICLSASELRESAGLGIVHVILVNPQPAAESKLQCLGKVAVAKDAATLTKAIADAIDAVLDPADITVAALDDGEEVPATVELYAAGDKQPVVRARSGAHLQVAGGIYDVRVVKTPKSQGDDAPKSVDPNAEGIRPHVELFPGAQLALRIPLGGKRGAILASVLFNGQEAPPGTRVAVFRVGDTEFAITGGSPGEPISVPPGRYDLRATIPGGATGNIEVWKPEVSVVAGNTTGVTLAAAQRRGSLLVNVVSNGRPVEGAVFALLPPGGHDETVPEYEAGVELPVPSGTYSIRARIETPVGNIIAMHDPVTVSSNQDSRLTIDLGPTALLTVEIAGHTAEDGINVDVIRAGDLEPSATLPAFAPFCFPPGKYDIRIGENRGVRSGAQQRVILRSGDNKSIRLTPP